MSCSARNSTISTWPAAALELHHLGAALLHQAHGVLERLLARGVRHERHVGHQERAIEALHDRTAVIDDVLQRDGHGRVVTLDDHAERIADQHQIDARVIHQRCEARVVGRDRQAIFSPSAFMRSSVATLTGGRGA